MSEIGIEKNYNGMKYLIERIEYEVPLKCNLNCYYKKENSSFCKIPQLFDINIGEDSYKAIVVTIVATNINAKKVGHVDDRHVFLVDSNGFSHKGSLKCKDLPQSEWGDYNTEFLPQTKVRYKILFSTLTNGLKISKILITPFGDSANAITFSINSFDKNVNTEFTQTEQIEEKKSQPTSSCNNNNYYQYLLLKIKVDINTRLKNKLTEKEQVRIENRINTKSYELKLLLNSKKEEENEKIKKELTDLIEQYENDLANKKQNSKEYTDIKTRIDELYNLEPREFEEYIRDLLVYLNYDNVNITPYSNDKGVDIFCEKKGSKIAVQCKRYRGTVGSPEIISFIGAMSNANVDYGIFVTTGMFTFEAESLAMNNPILLINRIKLAKIINNILNNNTNTDNIIQDMFGN